MPVMKKIALKKRLPPPRRCREECKVTCDPIKRPMVGGPGSLPPKRKPMLIRKEEPDTAKAVEIKKPIAIRKEEEPAKLAVLEKKEKIPIMKTGGAGRGLPPKPELKPIKPKMMGGPGSLPPKKPLPEKTRVLEKKAVLEKKPELEKKVEVKAVKEPMVGGPGSLPPKKKPVQVEAKKIEAPKIEKKEAKMVGGPGSLPPKPKIEKAEVKKPAPAPAKKVEDKED